MRYYQAIVLLLAAFAVLGGIQLYVQNVDPAVIPEEWLPLWQGIDYVFVTSAASILFVFIRNIFGYAENWFETDSPSFKYEAKQLGATWTKYELYLKGFTAAILAITTGTPYQQYAVYIAGAIGIIVDLITKAIKSLQ